jgi:hypothetical protein
MILLISLLALSQSIFVFCAAPVPKVAAKASSVVFRKLREEFIKAKTTELYASAALMREQKEWACLKIGAAYGVFGFAILFGIADVYAKYSENKN